MDVIKEYKDVRHLTSENIQTLLRESSSDSDFRISTLLCSAHFWDPGEIYKVTSPIQIDTRYNRSFDIFECNLAIGSNEYVMFLGWKLAPCDSREEVFNLSMCFLYKDKIAYHWRDFKIQNWKSAVGELASSVDLALVPLREQHDY